MHVALGPAATTAGRVLDDPVEKYLPEFQGQVLMAEQDQDRVLLKRPARPITVKDVLSHREAATEAFGK